MVLWGTAPSGRSVHEYTPGASSGPEVPLAPPTAYQKPNTLNEHRAPKYGMDRQLEQKRLASYSLQDEEEVRRWCVSSRPVREDEKRGERESSARLGESATSNQYAPADGNCWMWMWRGGGEERMATGWKQRSVFSWEWAWSSSASR